MRILETPLFAAVQERNEIAAAPVRDVLRNQWRDILLVAGTRITENASFYLFTVWVMWYATNVLGIRTDIPLLAVNIAAGLAFVTIPLFGWASDRLTRRSVYITGCILFILFAAPYYALLNERSEWAIIVATVAGVSICHALLYSVQASLIPELFGTSVRCTGASIGYQLGGPLAGGIAPLVATGLATAFPDQYWPLAAYIIVNSAISLVCVILLAETSRKEIGAV
jgi:MFS family permease